MKTFKTLLLALAMIATYTLSAQVAINTDGSSANGSAMLDVKSTNKGLLIPNIALTGSTDATTISSPAVSLLVYNTATVSDVTPGYYYNSGTTGSPVWTRFVTTLAIGDSYGGGKIFWLDATGQHGLIAATADQTTDDGIQWYNNGSYTATGATLDGVYAGKANTNLIIANQGAGSYAAQLCADYSITVNNVYYDDWYLPSKYELNLLYQQKTAVGGFAIASSWYWSSTEYDGWTAWMHYFFNGETANGGKSATHRVRAVRDF